MKSKNKAADLIRSLTEEVSNEEVERGLVIAALKSDELRTRIAASVPSSLAFGNERYRLVYDAMRELDREGTPVGLITIMDRLASGTYHGESKLDLVTQELLHDLEFSPSPLTPELDVLLRRANSAYRERRARSAFATILGRWKPGSGVDDVFAQLEMLMHDLAAVGQDDLESRHAREIVKSVWRHVESSMADESGQGGRLYTGIEPIDALIEGFEGGKYVILSSYSKHGKTTLASAIAAHMADPEHGAAVVNVHQCEVDDVTQAARIMCGKWQHASLRQDWIVKPDRAPTRRQESFLNQLVKATGWLAERDIYFEKPGLIRVEHVEARARLLRARFPDRPIVVVVDYIQKMTSDRRHEDSQARLKYVSERLIHLAKTENVLVLALSQYTDAGNQNLPVAQPLGSQIRGSKDLRNDCDLLLSWHRPFWSEPGAPKGRANLGILEVAAGRGHEPRHVVVDAQLGTGSIGWYRDTVPTIPGLETSRILEGQQDQDQDPDIIAFPGEWK